MTKRDEYLKSFRSIANELAYAFTRPEVESLIEALRLHGERFPEDKEREIDHRFPRVIEALEAREREAEQLGYNTTTIERREQLLKTSTEDLSLVQPLIVPLVEKTARRPRKLAPGLSKRHDGSRSPYGNTGGN